MNPGTNIVDIEQEVNIGDVVGGMGQTFLKFGTEQARQLEPAGGTIVETPVEHLEWGVDNVTLAGMTAELLLADVHEWVLDLLAIGHNRWLCCSRSYSSNSLVDRVHWTMPLAVSAN